ncbi:uncharacterized protein OCT59_002530 [Rhizophagus irregularis]|uniref:Uncharacterized protein n=1 Tax=Rhizophagus irregularis (strain DAOM 181602 / DAOM 197198 / MUCL 43194) TaxID=747089 RepID=A0A2P4P035_RHIID|nr:hypothetical protein GLOIN_2v1727896 [Rhizophagus irregularis DAOM 181602=DAOM 197198]POG58759.1 hypothetical protein GLOIN_2v1727896 [Rhizophagus irregularis DAOM 181602=DAOM 197198]UZO10953.1 hypothetical protein OCT59_002530 [Rhizophagus irregularis]|eukprot:XP_025165625.1 hypothetical protein GLOIN_2v1727896 [Rhizophagus irregularis DAOM 181602=DAOM 197198]
MNMSDTKKFIKVIRKEPVGDDIPIRIKLKITDKLSEIREQLQIDSTILMDDTLFFSDRDSNNIMRKRETEVYLEDIIIDDTIYLKTCDPSPDYFKGTLSLEYGRTLTPINSKIEIAEKKAFTIDEIELIRPDVTSNNEKVNFNSKNSWEKKINMFLKAEAGLMNFEPLELSFTNTRNKNEEIERNYSYSYTKISKMHLHLKLEGLKPTNYFIREVEEAVKLSNRKKLGEINTQFGQFVPTKVTLGGIVYYTTEGESNKSSEQKIIGGSSTIATSGIPAANLNIEVGLNNDNSKSELKNLERKTSSLIGGETNFNKKKWVISLCDYKTWRCIEFQDPINIFELLNDNLRKDIYKVLGKKILYYDVISREQYLGYGEREILKLPLQGKICETINNKDADCCVFATVVDEDDKKNDFFNCQIYYPPQDEEVPRLIIHCYQKQKYQSKRKLKIGFMIIGYDVNFNSSDKLNDEIRVEVINNPKLDMSKIEELMYRYDFKNFGFNEEKSFLGIPVLSELDKSNKSIIIGHYFLENESNEVEANMFAYCLIKKEFVKLPKSCCFHVLVISGSPNSNTYGKFPFNEKRTLTGKKKYIVEKLTDPKYINVYSEKVNCGPVFLKQKKEEIKLKYADCRNRTCSLCKNRTSKGKIKCAYFFFK